jgi:hypothetical protein
MKARNCAQCIVQCEDNSCIMQLHAWILFYYHIKSPCYVLNADIFIFYKYYINLITLDCDNHVYLM